MSHAVASKQAHNENGGHQSDLPLNRDTYYYWSIDFGLDEIRRLSALVGELLEAMESVRRRRLLWGAPFDNHSRIVIGPYETSSHALIEYCAGLGMGFGWKWSGGHVHPALSE